MHAAGSRKSTTASLRLPGALEKRVDALRPFAQLSRRAVGKRAGRASGQGIGGETRGFGRGAPLFREVRETNERQRLVGGVDLAKRLGPIARAQIVQKQDIALERIFVRGVGAMKP